MTESLRRRAGRFGLDVVLVNVWEGSGAAAEAERYCQIWGIEATVLLDVTAEYARKLGIRGVPTNVLVDETGTVREVGVSTSEELLQAAARLAPGLLQEGRDVIGVERIPSGFSSDDKAE